MPIDDTRALLGCTPGHFGDREERRRTDSHFSIGSLEGQRGCQVSRRRFGVRAVYYGESDDITLSMLRHKKA
jgi:hypothetical protein